MFAIRQRCPVAATLGLTFLGAIANRAYAQTPEGPGPSFDVASVKPSDPAASGTQVRILPGGEVISRNATLHVLIVVAFKIHNFQEKGGPSWLDSDRFDIDAKPSRHVSDQEARLMMRSLLADRFHLVVHTETKELPAYVLIPVKSGAKLKEAGEASGTDGFHWSGGRIEGKRVSVADIADALTSRLQQPVLDYSGIKGLFDFTLEYTPDTNMSRPPDPTRSSVEVGVDPNGPSIFSALQRQLGLKLEARKAPVHILAIDSAQKPSGN